MQTFQLNYNGNTITAEKLTDGTYCVHLPGKDMHLQYKEDNEGAEHWLNLASNHETEETIAIGSLLKEAIEAAEK